MDNVSKISEICALDRALALCSCDFRVSWDSLDGM
jgi:hypothetical protein